MNKTSAAILVLLAIGIYYSFTSPQYQRLSELRTQALQYQNALDNASRIAETRDSLAGAAESIPATERDRLMKALPDNVDAVGLARELDVIASRYGISIKSVSVDNKVNQNSGIIVLPEGERPFEKSIVSFSFISDYQNFVRFLGDLEKSLRIMDIRSADFKVGENNLYEHELSVETYWLK